MMIKGLFVLLVFSLFTGCASTSRVDQLENKLKIIEAGLLENQKSIRGELNLLHSLSENEFSKLNHTVSTIKKKTDKFTVRKSSNTLLFEPTRK